MGHEAYSVCASKIKFAHTPNIVKEIALCARGGLGSLSHDWKYCTYAHCGSQCSERTNSVRFSGVRSFVKLGARRLRDKQALLAPEG